MAVMMGSRYSALRDAGVPDDKAQRAAEDMAGVSDVGEIKGDVSRLKVDVAGLKSDVAVMKWMLGFNVAMQLHWSERRSLAATNPEPSAT